MTKKIALIAVFTSFLMAFGQGSGQNFTSSPYSNFGLGEKINAQYLQLANGLNTRSGKYAYSPYNPATLGNIEFTTFDFGLTAKTGLINAGNQTSSFNGGGFSYLGLGFKLYHKNFFKIKEDSITKKISRKDILRLRVNANANIRPLTTVGYNYSLSSTLPIPSTTAHSGSGGLNVAEFGLGAKFNKWVSLGYSVGYVFGNLSDESIFSVTDSARFQRVSDISNQDIRGAKHNIGIHTRFKLDSTYHTFGAHYGFYNGIYTNRQRITKAIFVDQFGFNYTGDTVNNVASGYRPSSIPSYFGFGYSFQYRQRWELQLNYEQENWSSLTSSIKGRNRQEYGIGFILNPNDEKNKNVKRMPPQIRAGFTFTNTENTVVSNGVTTDITQSYAFIGFGLPIVRRYFDNTQVRSMINIDLGYLRRGTTANNLAKEEYFTARLGFNLGDIWFQRRKFN
jgi:hypothetical protein